MNRLTVYQCAVNKYLRKDQELKQENTLCEDSTECVAQLPTQFAFPWQLFLFLIIIIMFIKALKD